MRELEAIRKEVSKILDSESWIRIIHYGLKPAYTSAEKKNNVENENVRLHCAICRNLNCCCFPKNNVPAYPSHPNCHCVLVDIVKPQITADCPKDKFEKYLFSPKFEGNGKVQLFSKWGYDIMDSKYIAEEITRQAQEKYANGDFILGLLNGYGQRISIVTELERKDGKGKVVFITGWMVYPDGNIQKATPYGG